MISWIQNHLIRHGRWIFLSLLALIIVAFVFTIGNTPGCTTDRSGYQPNLFYGVDLNSTRTTDPIVEKVQLSAFLSGQQIQDEQQFQGLLLDRIARLHLADKIGIPGPDEAALSAYVRRQNAFLGPDRAFSVDAYTRFVDQIESNPRTPQGLVLEVIIENYRLEQVGEALEGPGYFLRSEALARTQRSRTEITMETATINFSEFSPDIEVTEEALQGYFTANQQRYEIPERIRAGYVFFPFSAYGSDFSEPTNTQLREHFAADRAGFVREFEAIRGANPASEEDAAEAPPVTFEDVREAVARSHHQARVKRATNEAAQNFAFTLYRDEIPRNSAAFNALLNQMGRSLKPIEPYTLQGARRRALSAEMLESAFALGGSRYYSDAFELEDGFGVLIYEGRISPEIPALEAVIDEVRSDFLADEKRRLFSENGKALLAALQEKISEGISFRNAAEALELTLHQFGPFSEQTAPPSLNRSALQRAQRMDEGAISPMLTLGQNGTFVHLVEKNVPELADGDEDLSMAENFLARFSAFSSGRALSDELIVRGLPADTNEE